MDEARILLLPEAWASALYWSVELFKQTSHTLPGNQGSPYRLILQSLSPTATVAVHSVPECSPAWPGVARSGLSPEAVRAWDYKHSHLSRLRCLCSPQPSGRNPPLRQGQEETRTDVFGFQGRCLDGPLAVETPGGGL